MPGYPPNKKQLKNQMKTQIKTAKILVSLAAASLVLAGCSKETDQPSAADNGKPTYVQVNVSYPKSPVTRAVNDPTATAFEVKLNTVDVFIFDAASNTLVKRQRLSAADFDAVAPGSGNNDLYSSVTKVATTTGPKKIYVGLNLPVSFPNVSSVGELKSGWTTALSQLVTASGIAMFSATETDKTLVETTDPSYTANNVFTVQVERLVAKVAVEDGGIVSAVPGGAVSDVEFAVHTSNKRLFPVKNVAGGIVKDPNWALGSYAAADFENFSDYTPIDATGTSGTNGSAANLLTAKYIPENTSEAHLQKETSYASIRAKFVPAEFSDETGASKGANAGQSAKTFWIVSNAGGARKFFDVQTEAATYAANNGGTVSASYTGGYCYYQAYLNPKNGYNAVRNDFYHVVITKINGPGKPDPDPKDPDLPVETPTDITVSVEIIAWTYAADNYELN